MKITLFSLFCVLVLSVSSYTQPQTVAIKTEVSASTIYEKSLPSVVLVLCSKSDNSYSQGSGVILRNDGVIATNYHVCGDAKSARVKLQNGDIYDDVSILDTDERKDIAILKIKAINLPVLAASDSDLLKIGANVYAIGAPKGLEGSITSGIISSIRAATEVSSELSGFRVIQFTAPISPGSSGSPLLDESGKVIGLAFASRVDGQSLNIAIPINYITPLVTNAKSDGRILGKFSAQESQQPKSPKTSTLDDIAGTYTGGWESNTYPVSGAIVLTVKAINGTLQLQAVFTGSEYLSEDTLETKTTPLSEGIWKIEYKGKKSKIKGTGLFKNGQFIGDYKFRKFIWTDTGQWLLSKTN